MKKLWYLVAVIITVIGFVMIMLKSSEKVKDIETRPEEVLLNARLAKLYHDQNKTDMAKEAYKKAVAQLDTVDSFSPSSLSSLAEMSVALSHLFNDDTLWTKLEPMIVRQLDSKEVKEDVDLDDQSLYLQKIREGYIGMAEVAMQSEDFDKAAKYYQRIIGLLHIDDVTRAGFTLLKDVAERSGDANAAIAASEEAIEASDDTYEKAWGLWGISFVLEKYLEDYPAAIAALKRSAEMHNDDTWKKHRYNEIAFVYEKHLNDTEKAKEWREMASSFKEKDHKNHEEASIYSVRAFNAMVSDDFEKAIADYEKAYSLAVELEFKAAMFLLKDVAKRSGDFRAAIAASEEVIEASDDVHEKALRLWGIYFVLEAHLRDYPAAIAALKRSAELNVSYQTDKTWEKKRSWKWHRYQEIAHVYDVRLNDPEKAKEWRDKIDLLY